MTSDDATSRGGAIELTSEHIKSHLQKFRLNTKAAHDAFVREYKRSHAAATERAQSQPHFGTYPVTMTHARSLPGCERCVELEYLIQLGVGADALSEASSPSAKVLSSPAGVNGDATGVKHNHAAVSATTDGVAHGPSFNDDGADVAPAAALDAAAFAAQLPALKTIGEAAAPWLAALRITQVSPHTNPDAAIDVTNSEGGGGTVPATAGDVSTSIQRVDTSTTSHQQQSTVSLVQIAEFRDETQRLVLEALGRAAQRSSTAAHPSAVTRTQEADAARLGELRANLSRHMASQVKVHQAMVHRADGQLQLHGAAPPPGSVTPTTRMAAEMLAGGAFGHAGSTALPSLHASSDPTASKRAGVETPGSADSTQSQHSDAAPPSSTASMPPPPRLGRSGGVSVPLPRSLASAPATSTVAGRLALEEPGATTAVTSVAGPHSHSRPAATWYAELLRDLELTDDDGASDSDALHVIPSVGSSEAALFDFVRRPRGATLKDG